MLSHPQFLTLLTSKSLSRAGVVQILSHLGPQILRTRPFLGPDFSSRRSHKTMEKHSISRTSYPPNPHVSHLCFITSARSHLLIDRSSAATFSIVGSYIPKLPLIIAYSTTTNQYSKSLSCCYVLSLFLFNGPTVVLPASGACGFSPPPGAVPWDPPGVGTSAERPTVPLAEPKLWFFCRVFEKKSMVRLDKGDEHDDDGDELYDCDLLLSSLHLGLQVESSRPSFSSQEWCGVSLDQKMPH